MSKTLAALGVDSINDVPHSAMLMKQAQHEPDPSHKSLLMRVSIIRGTSLEHEMDELVMHSTAKWLEDALMKAEGLCMMSPESDPYENIIFLPNK